MAYKRPLVNWARIPGYWWIDSWDSLCSLHLCLTTGTDCTEKGAPHVHFFHCHPFWMGGTSQVDSKKGLKMRHFYIYLRGSMFFMGGRNQLRRATSSVGLHFGLGSLVQHLVFPMGALGSPGRSDTWMTIPPCFYLGHITYISPTTGFVDVWGRCMIWWLSILDGCDKPSWPLLLFDVDAVFCCRGIAGRMCSCRKLSKPQAVDEMAVTCSILVHWSTLGIRNAGSLDSC